MADRAPTTITVPDAYGRAKAALAAGDTERATAITQHILRYYPHYLDAYRLLGEIYLERGRPDEASRFFSHVLNADPQSVLAHVGRAIIAEERGQIDSAIDSYERAFEIDPSIAELRGELLRLYTVRYGSAGATIRTTPSGLAYVHLRAGLREAAINELSYVAQVRPDRWDIEVALAEALWRNEQLDEAAAVAGDILAGHAACVKCNWMLGYIHWTNGRTERARPYLMEAVAADPTYRIAQSIWETTPWPLDREIIRAQPAVVPAWSAQELASGDLDLTLPFAGLPETPAGAAPERSPAGAGPGPGARPSRDWSRGRPAGAPTTPLPEISAPRITQPFGPRPPLPDEHPAAADAAPDLAGEDRLGAPGESGAADTLPVPAPLAEPLDLDWLDEWASETAIPAAAAPAAPGAATEAGLPAAELTPDQIAAPREPADAPPAVPAGDDLPAAPPPAADAPAAAAPAAPGAATEAGLPVAELAPDQIATPREPADAPPAVPAGDEPPAALPLAADAPAARAPSAPPAATKASLPAARLSPDQIAGLSEDQLLDWLSSIAAAPVVEDGVAAAAPPAVAPDSRAADSIPVEDFTHDELLEWLAKTAPVTGDVDRIPDQESTLPAGAPPGEETTPAAPGENGEQDQKKTSQNGAEVGYNHTIQDESDSARALVTAEEDAFATHATSEEDQMAPSYKEDDDQERQFDFDWDRDALPDYLKPFLTDDAAAQGAAPAASAPAPTIPPAPPPAANAGGLPDWLREGSAPGAPAPGSGQPFNFGASASPPQPPPQSAGFAPGRPASPPPPAPQNSPPPAGPGSQPAPSAPPPAAGMADFDFGDIKPFDFGATSGGEFDFNSDSLPSWLGSAPAPAAAPAPQEVMLGRPLAGDRTPDPALDSPEMPDWLRTPAPPAAAAPPPAPAPAASAEFDFGSDTLPSWLGGGAATSPPAAARPPAPAMPPPAAPAPTEFDLGSLQPFDFGGTPAPPAAGGGKSTADEFDFGDIQPFDFGAAGAAAAPAAAPGGRAPGGFDLGAVQPFDFGPAPAPPAAQSAATPAAAPADDFDFGNIQPFDFGGTAPAPAPAAQPADGGEVDDFIDFLSVGNASPSLAAAPEAPAGADFDLDLQPFSFEGLDLGPAAPSAPPAPPSGRAPTGEPAWGRAAGAPPSRLPADPRPEEMAGLTGDEFSFEPFMFDQGGGSAAGHAPATPAPALPGAPPPAPFSFGPDQPGGAMNETGLPPGLEDLPDLKPFSFEGMEMAGDLGSGFETASQAQAFGRRATDRPESGRPPMPFGFEDESSAD
ncbi:MAG TPA: tetratricopeptide repeat protein, partial [Chloroflexia bacterium]|nr:tetratricopeptide repeat protein [Chloroflexia bacterium]